ncbi:MAG: hypothetical protein P8M12_00685 [Flavobacteriales bacterium]|jgi:hypothetical protein|nr:hypothetical protein [Flavobacteriales bacterium]
MNYSKNDIEYYLLNKDYAELTTEERAFISMEVKSEEEYNNLKKLFSSFESNTISNNTIEPNPIIKTELINEFRQHNNQNKIWLNVISTTLFPKDKKIISMPGVQLCGIAASLIIILTIYTNYEFSNTNSAISLNENQIEQPKIENNSDSMNVLDLVDKTEPSNIKNKVLANNEKEEGIHKSNAPLKIPILEEETEFLVEFEDKERAELEVEIIELDEFIEHESTGMAVDFNNSTEDLEFTINEEDDILSDSEELVLSGFSEPSVSSNKDALPMTNRRSNKEVIKTTISRSLKEDKELIGLFYTAL